MVNATSPWLNRTNELLYIATDEPDLTWFDPFKEKFKVRFLRDFEGEVGLLPQEERGSLLGMVEQIILSHGRTFSGTWFSTFSSYVCRLRGYYHNYHKGAATRSEIGRTLSRGSGLDEKTTRWLQRSRRFPDNSCYVYAPESKRFEFQAWKMPQHAFYPREWSLAWENIDHLRRHDVEGGRRSAGNGDDIYHPAHRFPSEHPPLSLRPLEYDDFKHQKPVYPDEAVKKAKEQRKREKAANLAARDARG